jgi:hypothetical protein
MCWPLEAEAKLGVTLSDRQLERVRTVGQFLLVLREAGAHWPDASSVRLVPRRRWWSPHRWRVVETVEDDPSVGASV